MSQTECWNDFFHGLRNRKDDEETKTQHRKQAETDFFGKSLIANQQHQHKKNIDKKAVLCGKNQHK